MTNKLKLVLCLFSFSIISYLKGQADSNSIRNNDLQNEAIQIREKINNFMNEKLLIDGSQMPIEHKLVNQEEKLILLQSGLDSMLSLVSHQNLQMDSVIINLKLLEDYLDLNKKLNFIVSNNKYKKHVRENPLIVELQKNKTNIVYVNAPQSIEIKSIESVTVMFDKNSFKLNYSSVLTLDSILPFIQNKNMLLTGYYNYNVIEKNYKFLVKRRVKDVKLYLVSKGINPLLIATEFIKDSNTDSNTIPNNFAGKVHLKFGK